MFPQSGPSLSSVGSELGASFLAQIGSDLVTGEPRFTFGNLTLMDGVPLIPMIMGLFGVAEVLTNLEEVATRVVFRSRIKNLLPNLADWKASLMPIGRGTVLGFFLGLFGKDFATAGLPLRILLSGQFFNTLSGPVLAVLSMSGKEKSVQYILLSALIFNVVLNCLLIPGFGIAGAAMATATVTAAWSLVSVFAVYKNFGFTTFPVGWRKAI